MGGVHDMVCETRFAFALNTKEREIEAVREIEALAERNVRTLEATIGN